VAVEYRRKAQRYTRLGNWSDTKDIFFALLLTPQLGNGWTSVSQIGKGFGVGWFSL
jgi:hypothetical protein